MKNIVTIEYKNKKYIAQNSVNPKFYSGLIQLFTNGYYSATGTHTSITRLLSIHPNFSGNFPYDINPSFNALSSVAIYGFTEPETGLNLDDGAVSGTDIYFKNVTAIDYNNVNSYALTSINNYSFAVKQSFYYYPPATADVGYVTVEIKSFGIRTNHLTGSTPTYRPPYLPFVYITAKSLIGEESLKMRPGEIFDINWSFNFNSDFNINTTVNKINSNIHDTFRTMLCEIMKTSSYTFPSLTSSHRNNFQITGIVGFEEPTGAFYNNGSTADGSAFYMTPDTGTGTLSANSSYTTVSYFVSYTNNTGQPQKVGSILLSGSRSSDVFSVVPIAWVSAKDLWGVDIRILNPKERIEITWDVSIPTTIKQTQS